MEAMASKLSYENATKALQVIRNFLAGKTLKIATRHALSQSSRNIPRPNLPSGEAHKFSNNYYTNRDKRGAVLPPLKVNATQEFIGSSQESENSRPIPGEVYHPRP